MWRDPNTKWASDGGLILQLGDSAHSFLPTSANGATQAMEDGISIAACLRLAGKHNVPLATRVHTQLRLATPSQSLQGCTNLKPSDSNVLHVPRDRGSRTVKDGTTLTLRTRKSTQKSWSCRWAIGSIYTTPSSTFTTTTRSVSIISSVATPSRTPILPPDIPTFHGLLMSSLELRLKDMRQWMKETGPEVESLRRGLKTLVVGQWRRTGL